VKEKLGLPILLMAVFAVTRWPGLMPENFSAAYAIAFCAGAYFSGAMAWWLPLGTLLVTDMAINTFYYEVAALDPAMLVNYVAFAGIIFFGRCFRPQSSSLWLVGGGLLGALVFYVITNTGAWIQLPYVKTFGGWIQALTVGLPGYPPTWTFFRSTMLSGGLFTLLFVGSVKISQALESKEEKPEEEPDEEPEGEAVQN
jgi:hypothetical protein